MFVAYHQGHEATSSRIADTMHGVWVLDPLIIFVISCRMYI